MSEFTKRMDKLKKDMINKPKQLNARQEKEVFNAFDTAFQRAYSEVIRLDKLNVASSTLTSKVAFTNQLYEQLTSLEGKTSKEFSKMIGNQQKELMSILATRIPDKNDRDKFLKAFNRNVDVNSKKALNSVIGGNIYKKNAKDESIPLDTRLWRASLNASDKMNDAIQSCIAQGMSSTEMSKVIQEYGSGGHRTWDRKKIADKLGSGYARKYSGGLDYEALRVARTTNTHIAQLSVIETAAANPYMQGVIWNSLHISGRTCEECISRNGKFFKLAEVPFDHPNGMCHLEPALSMNGKVIPAGKLNENLDVAEAIGDDIGKWIRGEDNSGMMDTVPGYKDLPVVKVAKPKEKKKQTGELNATKEFGDHARQFANPIQASRDEEYQALQQAAKEEWEEYKAKTDKYLKGKYSNVNTKEVVDGWKKLGIKKGSQEWKDYRKYVQSGNSFRMNQRMYSGDYVAGGKNKLDKDIDAFASIIGKSKLDKDSKFIRYTSMDCVDDIFNKLDVSWLGFDSGDKATANYNWGNVKNSQKFKDHYMGMLNSNTAGKEFKFDSFTSVSYDKSANAFSNKEVLMEIYAPKGTEALYTENHAESEIVLQAGTSFKILGFEVEGNKMKLMLEAIVK